jgi:hypothetical protein
VILLTDLAWFEESWGSGIFILDKDLIFFEMGIRMSEDIIDILCGKLGSNLSIDNLFLLPVMLEH